MCGYIQRTKPSAAIDRAFRQTRIENPLLHPGRFWPGSLITDVIIGDKDGPRPVDAIWWFMLTPKEGKLIPDRKITCFNARKLESTLWRKPFARHRCIIPASDIVETKDKHSYLMESSGGLLLGGMYRIWKCGEKLVYSCTVITRDPIEKFSVYQDKSIPLFLPNDDAVLKDWLDPSIQDVSIFDGIIHRPKLPIDLMVTPVKNSQNLAPLGETMRLERDA